jgi:hypothetical protein
MNVLQKGNPPREQQADPFSLSIQLPVNKTNLPVQLRNYEMVKIIFEDCYRDTQHSLFLKVL